MKRESLLEDRYMHWKSLQRMPIWPLGTSDMPSYITCFKRLRYYSVYIDTLFWRDMSFPATSGLLIALSYLLHEEQWTYDEWRVRNVMWDFVIALQPIIRIPAYDLASLGFENLRGHLSEQFCVNLFRRFPVYCCTATARKPFYG